MYRKATAYGRRQTNYYQLTTWDVSPVKEAITSEEELSDGDYNSPSKRTSGYVKSQRRKATGKPSRKNLKKDQPPSRSGLEHLDKDLSTVVIDYAVKTSQHQEALRRTPLIQRTLNAPTPIAAKSIHPKPNKARVNKLASFESTRRPPLKPKSTNPLSLHSAPPDPLPRNEAVPKSKSRKIDGLKPRMGKDKSLKAAVLIPKRTTHLIEGSDSAERALVIQPPKHFVKIKTADGLGDRELPDCVADEEYRQPVGPWMKRTSRKQEKLLKEDSVHSPETSASGTTPQHLSPDPITPTGSPVTRQLISEADPTASQLAPSPPPAKLHSQHSCDSPKKAVVDRLLTDDVMKHTVLDHSAPPSSRSPLNVDRLVSLTVDQPPFILTPCDSSAPSSLQDHPQETKSIKPSRRTRQSLPAQLSKQKIFSADIVPLITYSRNTSPHFQLSADKPLLLSSIGGPKASWKKIAEASYSEVYRVVIPGFGDFVVKIIPITMVGEEANEDVPVTSDWDAIRREVQITQGVANFDGFVKLHGWCIAQGKYPPRLLSEWDAYKASHPEYKCENIRPSVFSEKQNYALLFLHDGGEALEDFRLRSWEEALDVFKQVSQSLAEAEATSRFEHRDLHWGNILVRRTTPNELSDRISKSTLRTTVIDFTLSRMEGEDGPVATELEGELFEGLGDMQFDVYRQMRHISKSKWTQYHNTNILWLSYLASKLVHDKNIRPIHPEFTSPIKTRRKRADLAQFLQSPVKPSLKKPSRAEIQAFNCLQTVERLLQETVNALLNRPKKRGKGRSEIQSTVPFEDIGELVRWLLK
ncbi:hypothetical protein BT69DRAFT_1275997 [Atractiella rhizophila]|nr:hypothetical protein BT69DRAFT_1275997 [Atractiella rhizophila]